MNLADRTLGGLALCGPAEVLNYWKQAVIPLCNRPAFSAGLHVRRRLAIDTVARRQDRQVRDRHRCTEPGWPGENV
jgi:hypothetical protein